MDHLKGKDLESLVVEQAAEYRKQKLAHVTRSGVQAVRMKDDWQVIQSLPDFEGVTVGGRQFLFDCKVCSQASFDLSKYRTETRGARARQLRHMFDRAEFGVPCFFLLHWNYRSGKTFAAPAQTFAFPVGLHVQFWQEFLSGRVRSISRGDCVQWGAKVAWVVPPRGRKARPDFLAAIKGWSDEN